MELNWSWCSALDSKYKYIFYLLVEATCLFLDPSSNRVYSSFALDACLTSAPWMKTMPFLSFLMSYRSWKKELLYSRQRSWRWEQHTPFYWILWSKRISQPEYSGNISNGLQNWTMKSMVPDPFFKIWRLTHSMRNGNSKDILGNLVEMTYMCQAWNWFIDKVTEIRHHFYTP